MPYTITSATTKPTRAFTSDNKTFAFLKIKVNAYTGYILAEEEGRAFLIAEQEKALVDYLYFVAIGRKPFNDRLNISSLDKTKLIEYAKYYNRAKLLQMIGNLK